MKTRRVWKSVSAVMLTLALLMSMVSVMGAFTAAAGDDLVEFNANFYEGLDREDNAWSGSAGDRITEFGNPADASATDANIAHHAWLSERFDLYRSFNTVKQCDFFGETIDDDWQPNTRLVYAEKSAVGSEATDRSLMLDDVACGQELFFGTLALVPKYNGAALEVKNFEATVKFAMLDSRTGGLLFAFHEGENNGRYAFDVPCNYRINSGSVLGIGNVVDEAAPTWNGPGNSNDSWKFYPDGMVECRYMTNVDKTFSQDLLNQWYTLKVKVVNGTAVFTLTSADGTVNETMLKECATTEGTISIGMTGRKIMVNEINVVELDEDGMPVDIGYSVTKKHSMNIEGMPSYEGGYITAEEGRDGYMNYVVEDTDETEYAAFVTAVEEAGWTKYSENEAADNVFTTYQNGDHFVYVYFLPVENRVHVIDMPIGAVLPTTVSAQADDVCEPLFTQVQLSYATASEGMSYLVRLSDGRFIVIDGGKVEADLLESKHLYNLMKEQNVLDKITVAAWIVTHAHSDHQTVATEFMNNYTADDLVIEQVLYNYPTSTPNNAETDAFIAAVDAWEAEGTEQVTPFIGQEYYYADAKIEFLHTVDAYAPDELKGQDFNNTSSVFTIEIADQKIIILGDMHTIGNDHLVELFGDYLKSDICQFGHHGVGGGTVEVYEAIDPTVVVVPSGVFHYTNIYNYYRVYAPEDLREGQAWLWLENNVGGNVEEVIIMGFKEAVLQLPYTPAEGCDYIANRNVNGYVFEEAVGADAVVPNPFYELNVGEEENTVYYKGEAFDVPSKRVEQDDDVEEIEVDGLADVLEGDNTFELFIAIDDLKHHLDNETFAMFGTSTNGLNLKNNTLNVNLNRGNTNAIVTDGNRYYKGNVVGDTVINHIVGTYDAATGVLSIYENGVLINTATYADGFAADDVLYLGSEALNAMSGYTVLAARVYDECLDEDQVAAAYWKGIIEYTHVCGSDTWESDADSHWKECSCGEELDRGTHTGGKATCTDKALCEVCQAAYGNVDATNHTGETEVRNKKDATATEDGYTGDTYCKGCGEKLSTGKVIEKTGTTGGTTGGDASTGGTTGGNKAPATGDNSNPLLWALLAIVSGGILAAVLLKKKQTA